MKLAIMIYWFTGQPGHGKTTLAKALIAAFARLKASSRFTSMATTYGR